MTREQRAASRDKDLLEKSRLQARNRPGQPPHTQPGNPVVPVRNSPMYCDEYDRFNRDVAGELHAKKQQELQKKEVVYEVKRAENYYREQNKWDKMSSAQRQEEARLARLRDTGTGARRNKSGTEYNILTLDYNKSPGGQALSARDDAVKSKAAVRAANLYSKSHSVTHNIITGEPIRPFPSGGQ